MACPKLNIPWKRWATDAIPNPNHEHENYQAIERWATGILKCMPSAGGSALVYCGEETLTVTEGDGFIDGATFDFTLDERSTIGIWHSLHVYDATPTATFDVQGQITFPSGGWFMAETPVPAVETYSGDWSAHTSTHAAITRDAGADSFKPQARIVDGGSGVEVAVLSRWVAVIGANTEDMCFSGGG